MNPPVLGNNEIVVAARVSPRLRDSIDEAAASTGASRFQYIRSELKMVVLV